VTVTRERATADKEVSSCGILITCHPRRGVVGLHKFSRVCLSVCLSICQAMTLETLYVGRLLSHIRYISTRYGSSSYMKVIGSMSRSQEQIIIIKRNI